ncbi:lantibiotic dehydratase [Streptomyces sp. W16]|uniref:lantibiotic dehydratase n=1 Tax=Streptomyces sp. W16 TaxID=3076631 RepID=UPI00295A7C99|nr:lantibiotic dehydratase [Streptomyces sp. W16]MDV9172218.1 lantibiotic dehydratase [Streptomyces sp. W16]
MYDAVDAVLIRATVRPLTAPQPPWPDLGGNASGDIERWREWIGEVWADEAIVAAIKVASPLLVEAVHGVLDGRNQRPRTVRRAVISLMRYLLRMQHRATPFGLFAGPAPVQLGNRAQVRWGTEHQASVRADAEWLTEIVTALEQNTDLLRRLPVIADHTCVVRGTRIAVPHQPGRDGPAKVTLRRTPAADAVLELARAPIAVEDIVAKLQASYPSTPTPVIEGMVRDLVAHRILITSLRAPMTCDDALGHLVAQLDSFSTGLQAETAGHLRRIHQLLIRHNHAPANEQRTLRSEATKRMTAATGVNGRTLVVNLRPDCDVDLPTAVAREAERALQVMARISPYPDGPPAWQDYRARFLERYSMGALVPVRDVTDPDIGLGFPAGYRGSLLKRPVQATTRRDEHLLALAQDAAINQAREITLAEEDLAALAVGEVTQVPAHVELCFSVLATSLSALNQGRYTLSLAGLSQAAGTTTGRFLTLLEPADRDRMTSAYASLPTLTADTDRVQISSPPLRLRTQNVSRAPDVVRHVLSLGEHNLAATLDLDDLAVTADSQRLYLVSLSTGRLVEPSVMNAVELTNATHPLVRFLTEVHRSHSAVLAPFAWGAAARLPFLPEVRVGRTILSPACWRLRTRDLVHDDRPDWLRRFTDWRCRYGVTRTVFLGSDDQRLRLDLDHPTHQQLLRMELERTGTATLHEAPEEGVYGWLGRAHEITMPFASTVPPAVHHPRTTAVVRRDSSRLPGTSAWAYLKIYCHSERTPEILTTHLPTLLQNREGSEPLWWYARYSDPETHLRLRLRLPNPDSFGTTAQYVGAWAAALRDDGLIRRIQWDTDEPETGRYGTGDTLAAAEHAFAADASAAIAQLMLGLPPRLQSAVTAASFVDIAAAFTDSPAARNHWLTEHLLKGEGEMPSRDLQTLAIQLTTPDNDFAALRALPGGEHVVVAWAHRRRALKTYRTTLADHGAEPTAVLPSLLHMHHNRAAGIDPDSEAICRRLARTAALSWNARTEGVPR